jgi:hypothetical protein
MPSSLETFRSQQVANGSVAGGSASQHDAPQHASSSLGVALVLIAGQ